MKAFIAAAIFTSYLSELALGGASEQFHARHGNAAQAVAHHRRHHVRAESPTPLPAVRYSKRGKKCKTKTKTKTKTSSNNSTSSASCPSGSISVNGVCVGMLPDGGSDGGSQDTMATLNSLVSATGKTHAYFGQYAQATGGSGWSGSQLTQVMSDLKASGAIFQPAVMPTGGWSGLTSSDNSLAVAICTVMKQFTDEGIEVWLRFAHEVNWYQTDGTYQGGASDFIEGWNTVAAACKSVAPSVKMFFTPNVADLATYESYYPDPTTVDVIGVDFYPNQGTDLSTAFTSAMQPFHDKYCSSSGPFFAIGETGLGYAGSASDKVSWISAITASKSSMQYMTGVTWFNYQKGYDFKIVDPSDSSTTAAFVSWAQSG